MKGLSPVPGHAVETTCAEGGEDLEGSGGKVEGFRLAACSQDVSESPLDMKEGRTHALVDDLDDAALATVVDEGLPAADGAVVWVVWGAVGHEGLVC